MKIAYSIVLISVLVFTNSCRNKQASDNFKRNLNKNWTIQNSEKIKVSGKEMSQKNFNVSDWYQTTIPSTVLNVLVQNNVYEDFFFDKNLENIPKEQFNNSWWYRTEFEIDNISKNDFYSLVFEGINYKANIWLNETKIASQENIASAFKIFNLDITKNAKKGKNILAVEIIPPAKKDLTIGFVDWNPAAPDKNMGIWRDVKLIKTNEADLKNVFIKSKINLETFKEAELIITADLKNKSDKKIDVTLNINISEGINISKVFSLKAKEEKSVKFSSNEFQQLKIENPKLWWPNNLGEPNLYNLRISATVKNKVSDIEELRFGIREISEYKTEQGYKGYKINGKKMLIKGAGWVDDILLADTPEKVEAQLKYVKHLNLNTIRLEGFWGNSKTLYEKADELGILLMIGWSCHWEWEGYCNREELLKYMSITEPEDMQLHAEGYRDQVIWLRNHPGVFLWAYGSDKLPVPELEKKLNNYLFEYDNTRPVLASCKYKDFDLKYNNKSELIEGYINDSEVSGATAVKMLGPYAYITPNYWYIDTVAGGAFGFNTETGPGPQVPPLESIKKMIPKDKLWPLNDVWNYHSGRHEFQTLDRYIKAFNGRYGKCDNVEDFAFKSQISNYESIRAMFEAFAVNKDKATGIIQWMLNSAWPEMFWQLYDWYLMPNGAFYGTKKACQPLGLIYNYKDKSIYINNDYNKSHENLTAEIRVFNINSKELLKNVIKVNINELKSEKIFEIPELQDISITYFVDLKLFDNQNNEISNNFYWLSTKEDVLDFENSEWFMTPIVDYADFTALNTMPKANVSVKHEFLKNDNNEDIVRLTIKNTSENIAFFINTSIVGSKTGNSILPVFWDDNYFSLLPKEEKTIKASFKINEAIDGKPVFKYKGFNLN